MRYTKANTQCNGMPSEFSEYLFDRTDWSPNWLLGASREEWEKFMNRNTNILFPLPKEGFPICISKHPLWTKLKKEMDPIKDKNWREIIAFIGLNYGCNNAIKALTPPCIPSQLDMHIDLCMSRIHAARQFGSAVEQCEQIVRTLNCYVFAEKLVDELFKLERLLFTETNMSLPEFLDKNHPGTPATTLIKEQNNLLEQQTKVTIKTDYYLIECGGFKYSLPIGMKNNHAARNFLNGRLPEPNVVNIVEEHVSTKPGNIIHGGAYFGDMIPRLSKAIPEHFLYAFEPDSYSCKLARETIEQNRLRNVFLFEFALGEKSETVYFESEYWTGKGIGGRSKIPSTEFPSDLINPERSLVSVMNIDLLRLDSLSCIQLDIEGQELKAIRGAADSIAKYRPLLITEACNEEIINYLNEIGYAFWQRADNDYCWRHSNELP